MPITLDDLRRFAVARNFFIPTTLKRALHGMGSVQADPIRAPGRAQDLTLRHRVKDYLASSRTLTPVKDSVLVRVEQSGFRPEDEAGYQGAIYGWQHFVGGLERVTAGLD